ncbi:MAG TPA: hypothetical protein V6D48_03200, partial [Oculatellaceae cyanobacterium]
MHNWKVTFKKGTAAVSNFESEQSVGLPGGPNAGNEQQYEFLIKMERQTFTWGYARNRIRRTQRWVERLWLLGLLLAALVLFGINLGSLPLQDWGEGTVALVAREIGNAPLEALTWLYPKIGGKPYLEAPPLLHSLIAGAYQIGGVNEW